MLLATMAKRSGIPWDFIFSSDMHRAFKRDPAVYQNAIRLLGMKPQEIMMTAAHNDDLEAARKEGMQTAYINRPYEYGADQKTDFEASSDWDIIADTVELSVRVLIAGIHVHPINLTLILVLGQEIVHLLWI